MHNKSIIKNQLEALSTYVAGPDDKKLQLIEQLSETYFTLAVSVFIFKSISCELEAFATN